MNEKLRTTVAEALHLDPGNVGLSLRRGQEVAWDSLGHLRLVTAVEQAFNVRLSMQEIESLVTVADLAAVLETHSVVLQDE